jgi:hypothetical protein
MSKERANLVGSQRTVVHKTAVSIHYVTMYVLPFLVPKKKIPFNTLRRARVRTSISISVRGLDFLCRLGCRWGYHRVWITCSSIAFVDFSFVDLVFLSSL